MTVFKNWKKMNLLTVAMPLSDAILEKKKKKPK